MSGSQPRRRLCLASLAAAASAWAWPARAAEPARLDAVQSRHLRDWITVLIHAQVEQGPTPRWTHRDCAGLVRFAVAEALREHDPAWR
ncbi:MAG TPA: DUF1175 family protein, partial [Ideonella sp.]|nr:DUF1175 family protein [Ideonella sp.]